MRKEIKEERTGFVNCYADKLPYIIEKTTVYFRLRGSQLLVKMGCPLTIDQFITLDTIAFNKGICQRDLAKFILKDRANTGRILDSLEQKGFITRFIDTKNNRLVKKMGITENGLKELNMIDSKIERYLKSLTRKIDPADVDRVQETLKSFRIELEKVVEINI